MNAAKGQPGPRAGVAGCAAASTAHDFVFLTLAALDPRAGVAQFIVGALCPKGHCHEYPSERVSAEHVQDCHEFAPHRGSSLGCWGALGSLVFGGAHIYIWRRNRQMCCANRTRSSWPNPPGM